MVMRDDEVIIQFYISDFGFIPLSNREDKYFLLEVREDM